MPDDGLFGGIFGSDATSSAAGVAVPSVRMSSPEMGIMGLNISFAMTIVDSNGVAVDADSLPTYSVYEEDDSAAICTGYFSRMQTGVYAEALELSSTNGFTTKKTYSVVGEATVNGTVYLSGVDNFLTVGAESVSSLSSSVSTDGSYIDQGDVEDLFGTDNITCWSDLDNTDTIDGDRITRAIQYAEEFVENLFRKTNYTIPFTSIPYVLKHWCATIAGHWLLNSRPKHLGDDPENEGVEYQYQEVLKDIGRYTSYQAELDVGKKKENQPEAPFVVF